MRSFGRFKGWLVVCLTAAGLTVGGDVFGQAKLFKDVPTKVLEVENEQRKSELALMEQRLAAANKNLSRLQSEMETLVAELATSEQQIAESGVVPQAYTEVLVLLQTMRVQLKIELAGLKARQDFLRGTKPIESATQAEQVGFLEKKRAIAIRIRDLALEMAEKAEKSRQSGVISLEELAKIKIESENASLKVIELEAELAERKAALYQLSQPPMAALQQTGLEMAEKEARLQQVESQLKATAEKGPELLQAEIKRRMLGHLEQERDRLLAEISKQELERRWASGVIQECEEELARRKEEQ